MPRRVKPEAPNLSYADQRMARIRENQALLNSLGLPGAIQDAKLQAKPAKKPPVKRKRSTAKKEPTAPRRASSRLKGEPAENVEIKSETRGQVLVGGVAGGQIRSLSNAGVVEYVENTVQLDTSMSGEDGTLEALQAEMEDLSKHETDPALLGRQLNQYEKMLMSLEIPENHAAKVTPESAYSVAVHPSTSNLVVAVGDKVGNLGIWSGGPLAAGKPVGNQDLLDDPVVRARRHRQTINALRFHPSTPGQLFSFSYDGTVKRTDLVKNESVDVFDMDDCGAEFGDGAYLQHGVLRKDNPHLLCLAFTDGSVVFRDTRLSKLAWKHQLHEKKVQTVDVFGDSLCTASLDRTLKLWDMRKFAQSRAKSLLNQSLFIMNDSNSINSASFSPSGDLIGAVTQSNRIALIKDPVSKSGTITSDYSIRHNNRTGRWLPVFHLAWDPKAVNTFIVGSMEQPRRVDMFMYNKGQKKLFSHFKLEDEYLASVQSRHGFHPSLDIIACVNSSGRVHVFS